MGKTVRPGIDDLGTLHPKVAEEADDWDPSDVVAGSGKILPWKCLEAGHTWTAQITKRTGVDARGCPSCATTGFDPEKPAWFYLMVRPGEQQFGITNNLSKRKNHHGRFGWVLLDSAGSTSGKEIQSIELELKRWLRKNLPIVPGKTENWFTIHMEVNSITELKQKSGIETNVI